MLGNPTFQQDDDRAVLLLRQDIHSFCPRRYFEGLMMSCRLARPKSGLIERQLLGDFEVATDGGIWVAAGALRMRSLSSSTDLTRMWRRKVRAILEKAHSVRLSQEPCLGV